MGDLQQAEHGEGHDYAAGSPHIRHHSVRDRVVRAIHAAVSETIERNGQCRVTEIGAGHGAFTDHFLAAGAEVVVTEMSEPSADFLRTRYRHNPCVTVRHDPSGQEVFTGPRPDLVACVSVLHHIPDYLATVAGLAERIAPGGCFLSFQDPLWYPRRNATSLGLDRAAYLWWRVGRGDFARGAATRLRRLRGVLDESNPADMVEYHVVRDGVDERALHGLLSREFASVSVERYWSTQSPLLQYVGERFGPYSTFGIVARDRRRGDS
jgi:phospholipid N-methyltransferase